MARDSDHLAGAFDAENTGGVLSGLFAEENEFDHRTLWRIGTWGVAAVASVVVAVMANQSSLGWRRDLMAAADLARQAQQLQAVARESQNETRRLSSAIDTLNNDRDRLYTRVTVLEQGLDSVTGAIARQNVVTTAPEAMAEPPPAAQNQAAVPTPAPVATTVIAKNDVKNDVRNDVARRMDKPRSEAGASEPPPPATAPKMQAAISNAQASQPTSATPLLPSKSIMAPPDPGAPRLVEPEPPEIGKAADPSTPEPIASAAPKEPDAAEAAALPNTPVQRTEFAVDVGTANSIGGLRALWRGLSKSSPELAALRPIITVRESRTGLGMQLHLAAGPLGDAAAAAKICARLSESKWSCETTVFDGQRLAMGANERANEPPPAALKPAAPQQHRRNYYQRRSKNEDPAPRPEPSTLSRLFSR